VIIKQQPAYGFEALVVGRCKLASCVSQPYQNRSRLGPSLSVDFEHRDLAHRIYFGPPDCIMCLASAKVDPNRLLIEPGAAQKECHLV